MKFLNLCERFDDKVCLSIKIMSLLDHSSLNASCRWNEVCVYCVVKLRVEAPDDYE